MKFSIGDVLVFLDTEVYYCVDIRSGTYHYEMLNPKTPMRIRKRLFNIADLKRVLTSNMDWKYYPVKE